MNRVWGLPCLLWFVLCGAVATVYLLLWPDNKITGATPLLSYLVLRWGHALVWVLLAFSFLVRGTRSVGGASTANVLALLALGVYALFIIVFLIS